MCFCGCVEHNKPGGLFNIRLATAKVKRGEGTDSQSLSPSWRTGQNHQPAQGLDGALRGWQHLWTLRLSAEALQPKGDPQNSKNRASEAQITAPKSWQRLPLPGSLNSNHAHWESHSTNSNKEAESWPTRMIREETRAQKQTFHRKETDYSVDDAGKTAVSWQKIKQDFYWTPTEI